MSVFEHSVSLADRGIATFPMTRWKKPLKGSHGVKDATTDRVRLLELFSQPAAQLVAIATGTPSGIAVLDIDHQHGGGDWWRLHRHRLPETRTHRTRSGGLHLLFKHRPGLRCSTAKIAPGVDIRADGGGCIWWPAVGLPVLSEVPLAPWPDWLVLPPPKPAIEPPALAAFGSETAAGRYAQAAIRRAFAAVVNAATGTRNDTLNRETFALLRLAAAGIITSTEVAGAMARAGVASGLDRAEVEATIASALAARRIAR